MDDEQLAAHLDRLAAWIWEKPFESCADDPLCAVAIFDFGEPDASALCMTEIRGCTAGERHRLAAVPGSNSGLIWNAAEYQSLQLMVLPHLMPADLDNEQAKVSRALVRKLGLPRARAAYMLGAERALRDLPWAQRWPLTEDFVVFRWDPRYGSDLRASLQRATDDARYERWVRGGVVP